MFAVIKTSFTPCDCGTRDHISVVFVTTNREIAEEFVKNNNCEDRVWYPFYEVEEVEVR